MTDFPVPQGIQTSITYPELRLLQRYAHEAGTVLEIGTLYGFSCIGMALAGASVNSVDPHYEGPADRPDTWGPFLANCRRHGFQTSAGPHDSSAFLWSAGPHDSSAFLWSDSTHILAFKEAIEDFDIRLNADPPFGLAFIDGAHTWPRPVLDARIAMAHLRAPNYLAFHDVTPNWPGVWRAVRELTESGELVKLEQVQTMAIYRAQAYQK